MLSAVLRSDVAVFCTLPCVFVIKTGCEFRYALHLSQYQSIFGEMIIKLSNTQNGIITKQDIAELLKMTPNQAYSYIKKLKKEGKLELVQGGKYSKYKLVE